MASATNQPSTKAREDYRWAQAQYPQDREVLARLKKAADAEFETDVEAMRSTAAWLETVGGSNDAENQEQAARYRAIIAGIEGSDLAVAA